jgi:hypothetical protein
MPNSIRAGSGEILGPQRKCSREYCLDLLEVSPMSPPDAIIFLSFQAGSTIEESLRETQADFKPFGIL